MFEPSNQSTKTSADSDEIILKNGRGEVFIDNNNKDNKSSHKNWQILWKLQNYLLLYWSPINLEYSETMQKF